MGVVGEAGSPRHRLWGQMGHLRPVLLDLGNTGPAHCALVEIRGVAGRSQHSHPGPPSSQSLGRCLGSWAKGTTTLHCWPCGTPLPFLPLWGDVDLHQQMQAAPSRCSLFRGGL